MNEIFVFGSNLAGIHGAGSAKEAVKRHGAIYGQGVGRQGNSYGIPTKDGNFNVLSVETIKTYVDEFLDYARDNPDDMFNVVAIGCGLSGYTPYKMAPLFKNSPNNVNLPGVFKECL